MKAQHILHSKGTDVFAVSESDEISSAVAVLNDKNIGAVIVKNQAGEISGILSERDVVRRLGKNGPATLNMSVADCMTANPYTCSPEASLDEIMGQMTSKRIRHLPVTDGGKVVGVISIGDVVKRKIELAEQEAEALKEYIAT
ncbi:MAG: CBS domain-containing protein [Marinicaulis sp.]|nr:CBS domain-containing protein [Marinicaulis sp.]NNL89866.1 CBS domain-containing protein [Marinicaulis sp.]